MIVTREPSQHSFDMPPSPSLLPSAGSATAADYDFVIVGAGSTGCVLANRLSANGRHRVLLLEAGPRDTFRWIHIPMGYSRTMFHKELNWGFYTEPDPGIAGRRNYWPRGKVLGGSSAINGLLWVRGQREDFEHWEALGNPGWGWKDVLPLFKRSEAYAGGSDEFRGRTGELGVEDGERHELVEAFIAGAGQAGIPRAEDYNGATQEGAAYFQLTKKNGRRTSTAVSFLKPIADRANLKIDTGAQATGLVLDGTRARGVRFVQNGQPREVRAAREVILCAGALQSPQLLQLSGIGPAEHLREFGVPVICDLPGVGENLQDHLQIRLLYKCAKPVTNNDLLNSWWGRATMRLSYYVWGRRGPMASGINQGVLFTNAGVDSSRRPDIEFHFGTTSSDTPGAPVHPWSGFTTSICQLRPESKGRVRLKSADPLAAPALIPNYLSHPHDCAVALAGVKLVRRVNSTPAMSPYVQEEYSPGSAAQSDAELMEWIRAKGATTIFHPAGTCKMGTDAQAVVDPRLRVRGIDGLRVADCSIMPVIVSGNTNAACTMIGEKAAEMILQDAL